jgi:UDP-4-amino-4,6-dideoxy-N-acetyl-beta-L-altrosamine transaminase
MIPYARQDVSEADVAAVVAVLRSDFLSQGPVLQRFEEAVAEYTGARAGVAVCNGTAALHVACLALDLGPGDRLWTSAITFAASANCARYCGADVDFVDIDPVTWNISVAALRAKLELARATGTLPKIVVAVHLVGQPTEQETIRELALEFGFRVIEDASHSLGASRHGERVGSCRWSDITVFSFQTLKVITTGEGGMAMTNDDRLADRMRLLRNHGITRNPSQMTVQNPGPAYYEQIALGWNYRLTDIHAALGLSQLDRLDDLVAKRNDMVDRYDDLLGMLPLQRPTVSPGNRSAFHLYVVRLTDAVMTNQRAIELLRSRGIGANLHYVPVHLHPYYRALGFTDGMFPEAEEYGRTALTLPLYPALTPDEQNHVAHAVTSLFE